MNRTFERIGASSGLAFVALAALSGFIYPQQPQGRLRPGHDAGLGPRPPHGTPSRHDLRLLRRRGTALVRRLPAPRPAALRRGRRVAVADRLGRRHRRGHHHGGGGAAHRSARVHGRAAGRPPRSVTRPRARRSEHDLLLAHVRHDRRLPRRPRVGDAARRRRHDLARLDHAPGRRVQLRRGLDRRHLQQLPRPCVADHRLGRLRRLPRRDAHRQRVTAPPRRRRPADPSARERRRRGPFARMATAARSARPARPGGATPTRRTRPLSRDYGGDPRSAELARQHRAAPTRHLRARGRHAPRYRRVRS